MKWSKNAQQGSNLLGDRKKTTTVIVKIMRKMFSQNDKG